MRLLGLVTGSLLGALLLVAIVGVPRLAGPDETAPGDEPTSAPPVQEMVSSNPEPTVAARPAGHAPESAEPPAGPPDTPPRAITALPETKPAALAPAPVIAASPPAEAPPLRWHAFWSPFRSRVAANGFVAELSRVTGLDYRVVAVRPGVYEVAFGYEDEAEIDAKLATIRAATGLDMPGS